MRALVGAGGVPCRHGYHLLDSTLAGGTGQDPAPIKSQRYSLSEIQGSARDVCTCDVHLTRLHDACCLATLSVPFPPESPPDTATAMPRLRKAPTALALAFLCAIVWCLSHLRSAAPVDDLRRKHTEPSHQTCPAELEHLRSLRLTDKVLYSRRCIKPVISATVDRDDVVTISEPLFREKHELDLSLCAGATVEPCDPLALEVPPPYPDRTYPELIFGVATTAGRLRDSLGPISHWMSGSGAKLVALLTDARPASDDELLKLKDLFAARDIDATVLNPPIEGLTTSQNHFAIIRDMVQYSAPETQWLGILDDDTFFPSLHPLASELSRHDHTKPQYVGALSEDFRAVKNWGYMAFGGAGAFLSLPAARILDAKLEECLEETEDAQGDGILRDCVHRHTRARLVHVPGLHQQDMRGDVSGFFEAGLRVVSLHHWKSWYRHPVDEMALVARYCGDCFLQRWRFGGDTVLANGFSVSVYPGGLEGVELGETEETWGESGGAFEFSLGPMRPKMGEGEKRGFVLVKAEEVERGVVRQVYVRKGNSRRGEADEVAELLWDFNS